MKSRKYDKYVYMKKSEFDKKVEKEYGGSVFNGEVPIPNFTTNDCNMFIKLIAGAVIGFINGFWGGGGGMICVPLLLNVIKLPEKKAHATTLLIMLPLSFASLIIYFLKDNLPIFDALKIGIGFIIGGVLGALLLKKISNIWLEIIFSIIIIAGGIKMLI